MIHGTADNIACMDIGQRSVKMEKFLERLFELLQNASKPFPEDEWHVERDMVDMDDVKEVFRDIGYEYRKATLCYLQGPCEYQTEEASINHGWTPCEKELPKEVLKDCLVTLKNGAVFQALYSQITNEFSMVCSHDVKPFPKHNPVIAWRPMPSGYVPVDEDEM